MPEGRGGAQNASKAGGEKSLTVNCNNGDIAIQFVTE